MQSDYTYQLPSYGEGGACQTTPNAVTDMSTKAYRCGKRGCRKIVQLAKPPLAYRKEKRCRCGGKLHDYSSDRKRNKARTCNCDGYSFPHRKACGVWCNEHPTGPTSDDYKERHNVYD